ncbi:aminotransferase class I/II-fold pyridoxal phosphate-dependent enzyme [Zymobacter palmae]|uniref:8-amino-7-oxononanoate synthase n=1 Tax=Zymobacter palmae TaxID=33074 RepID=A0A348HET8_9GAMM|nr:8-amino-7-oxononanoate synthase [Zymobacter palmae]BBG30140.1 7-keto-8-aminopelargonatesynthetase [Zymobacter palmae]
MMGIPFASDLEAALDERRQAQCLRQRRTLTLASPAYDMAGNDYLGLARDPRIVEALADGARRYGAGSGASALVTGQTDAHAQLEGLLADWLGREDALVFPSGFQANLAIHDALLSQGDVVLGDRLNHASLLDGARLSGARLKRYPHLDMAALERRLQHEREQHTSTDRNRRVAVVSDGLFSMDGDTAPLRDMVRLSQQHDALLIVDDAHGVGVLGASGAGLAEAEGVDAPHEVPVLVGTLSKALGLQGAFIAGSRLLIDTLVQFARPYVYTTSLSPALAHAACASVTIARQEPERRVQLEHNIALFRALAAQAGLPLTASTSPIQPLIVGDIPTVMAMRDAAAAHGFQIGAIRPPTVPEGTARLRVTLSAIHTPALLTQLVDILATAYVARTALHGEASC